MPTLEKAIGLLQEMPERKLEANTEMTKRLKGFQGLITFAGTLPEDFDYKQELEDAREEKYARFI